MTPDQDPRNNPWHELEDFLLDEATGQFEAIRLWFEIDRLDQEEVGIRDLAINVLIDPTLEGRFPARVNYDRKNNVAVVDFEMKTFEHLVDRLAFDYGISREDIARLYMGSGLALHILGAYVERYPKKQEELIEIMDDPRRIVAALDNLTEGISSIDVAKATWSIWESSSEKRCHINALRFAATALFSQYYVRQGDGEDGADPYEQRITAIFRERLGHALQNMDKYISFATKVGLLTGEEAQKEAQYLFVDDLSEMDIALSIPMGFAEMAEVKSILQSRPN